MSDRDETGRDFPAPPGKARTSDASEAIRGRRKRPRWPSLGNLNFALLMGMMVSFGAGGGYIAAGIGASILGGIAVGVLLGILGTAVILVVLTGGF